MNKHLLLLLASLFFSLSLQGQYVQEWEVGSDALGLIQLNSPQDITIDGEGNIYVIDQGNHRIQKFKSNGEFLLKFDMPDTIDGEFVSPTDIGVDGQGNIYISDAYNGVLKFSSTGQFLSKIGSKDTDVEQFGSMAVDDQGNVYVRVWGKSCIQKFNSNGQFLLKFSSYGQGDGQFISVEDIVIDKQGIIYVSDRVKGNIQKFDSDGQFLSKLVINGISEGKPTAIDEQGNLYIAVYDYSDSLSLIRKFSASGQFITEFGSYGSEDGQFENSQGLAVDKQGNVYVSDNINHSLQKFSSTGQFLWKVVPTANGQFSQPTKAVISKEGNIYVVDHGNRRIQVFSPTGQFLFKFGSRGTGNTQFESLAGIDVDTAGNIYMADGGLHCVKKFNSKGEFLAKFGSDEYEADGYLESPQEIVINKNGDLYVLTISNDYQIQKFSSSGQFLLEFGFNGYYDDQLQFATDIALDEQGNVYVTQGFQINSCIKKFDSNGQFLFKLGSQGSGDGDFEFAHSIDIDKYGNIYVTDYPGALRVQKFSPDGQFLSKSFFPNYLYGIAVDGQENLYFVDSNGNRLLKYTSNITSKSYGYIQGNIYQDKNKDCIRNGEEPPLAGSVVIAQPGPYYGITDSLGNYSIAVDTGSYIVEQILPEGGFIKQTCPPNNESYSVSLKAYNDTIQGNDFSRELTFLPILSASVSSDRRRRCFTSNTTISYCNAGNALANDAKVHLQLPEYIVLVSANLPFTVGQDKHYIFDIGTLKAGVCGKISIIDSVVCDNPNIRNLTQCTKVWITPAHTTTPSPDWDQSDISLKAKCIDNGFVNLSLHNTGTGYMADSSSFRIYLDAQLVFQHTFKLTAGDSLLLQVPANGQTVRLEADQRPHHPSKTQNSITLEACGKNSEGKVSTGYVAQLPQDDEQPEVDIECLPIIDSYDPNDKLVLPAGVTENHYTPTNRALDYTIRFQNTGSDYAYKVVIVDTLSEHLDLATLQMGAASHVYKLTVSGKGKPVLTFTFDNINLPDSTRDRLGSNGYIKFSIKPSDSIAEKTVIENYAHIFFDYNEPIRTNTVTNSIYDIPLSIPAENTAKVIICQPNTAALAGNDRVICQENTLYLQASAPTYGQGSWKLIQGQAQIKDIYNPLSLLTNIAYGETILEWRVASSSCGGDSTVSKVTIKRIAPPTVQATEPICGEGVFILQVSGGSANSYRWYAAEDTLTVLGKDAIFTTSILTSSKTYYVSIAEAGCESGKVTVQAVVKALPAKPVIKQAGTDGLQASIQGEAYIWYMNGELLDVSTQQIQVRENGVYQVKVKYEGCSSALSEPYKHEQVTTGIAEQDLQVKIYPNPAIGMVFIELPASMQAQVILQDAMGRELRTSKQINQRGELSLEGIKAGIYILQIQTQKETLIRKLIVR